ncbi:GNAT family N-acetyltransferase [Tumebacillus sp. ITR2]|uniref:GNAT family N-acetyltransferase n=1 Tax=Tumebacillus amylolyticus TaxID=2801339 RepID=A0ABS1JFQ7_9BACL|nr:GNAT family N-acetyltransferase [Tumebacillus amylolyticus]MBL0389099.1 GNAT family N-acetyltransferase [Tumebacillus amylolyticus]
MTRHSTTTLAPGFTVRAPRTDEAAKALDVIVAYDVAEYGEPDYELEDVEQDWSKLDLNRNAWFVETADGQIAAYAMLDGNSATAFEHPNFRDLGLLEHLLDRMEARRLEVAAEQDVESAITIRYWTNGQNPREQELFAGRGYDVIRTFWRMQIEMQEAPPQPQLPEGITLRTYVPGEDDQRFIDMMNITFADHWDHEEITLESFLSPHRIYTQPDDWMVAEDETGRFVAGIKSRPSMGSAWITSVSVHPDLRGKGLGLAILHYIFGVYYRRGITRAWLAVDSENSTGATSLYERAGMRPVKVHNRFEKVLG